MHAGACAQPGASQVARVETELSRLRVRGKFLLATDRKFWIKGVTYGTFSPARDGTPFPERERIESDLAAMAAIGFNALRTYAVPPISLLDAAARHGLRVMVGLPWGQHLAFLDDEAMVRRIVHEVRSAVRRCARHPAVLCYALGNEIPASIVRWHGSRRIERFIRHLHEAGKTEDGEALFTYVSFPTTEYLQLPFLDLACFNVYLETPGTLGAYLARLQNLCGERPLVMAEVGLDSRRNGLAAQAQGLAWQLRDTFAAGCAGAFVFAWTDEWCRGGHVVEDWDFGLTTRDRAPKPALESVKKAFAEVPFSRHREWPAISVVVCSHNGSATIRETLEGVSALDYPSYEVIVVDDGSTDATAQIAAEHGVTLIRIQTNRGLSHARNVGWQEARGEIVAFIDDDAYPDAHWLRYLAHTFMASDYVAVGGPNIAPAGDGPIADCVANAPGGPVHVLLSDTEAEHIPGCNMAFRREALVAIGGFDPRYRAAGDDVDLCWRLRANGWKIGFHPAAMVWHHRRGSIRAYWKQQQGYGKAEALLAQKWPEKHNGLGHYAWCGRLYGRGLPGALHAHTRRIFHGRWGQAAFQSVYQPAAGLLSSLPSTPEWLLLVAALAALALLGLSWPPLLGTIPLLGVALVALVAQAVLGAARARFPARDRGAGTRLALRVTTAVLHLLQPIARLKGRLAQGLVPWRSYVRGPSSWRLSGTHALWSEQWRAPSAWLEEIAALARQEGMPVRYGGDFDRWDLALLGGALGGSIVLLGIEEHGAGRQLLRLRSRSRPAMPAVVGVLLAGGLATGAGVDGAWVACGVLSATGAQLAYAIHRHCGTANAALARTVKRLTLSPPGPRVSAVEMPVR